MEVDGQIAVGRDRVTVHGHTEAGGQRDDLCDGLDGSYLVVRKQNAHECDVVVKHGLERDEIGAPEGIDGDVFDDSALGRGQPGRGVERGVVFCRGDEDAGSRYDRFAVYSTNDKCPPPAGVTHESRQNP